MFGGRPATQQRGGWWSSSSAVRAAAASWMTPQLVPDDAAALLSHRCNVYVAQLSSKAHLAYLSGSVTRNFTVGAHHWIQRALETHPWRVTLPDK